VFILLGGAYIRFMCENRLYIRAYIGFLIWIYRPYIGGYIKGYTKKLNAKNIKPLTRYITNIFAVYGSKNKGNNKRSGANK
jgi:hypothetical protein